MGWRIASPPFELFTMLAFIAKSLGATITWRTSEGILYLLDLNQDGASAWRYICQLQAPALFYPLALTQVVQLRVSLSKALF